MEKKLLGLCLCIFFLNSCSNDEFDKVTVIELEPIKIISKIDSLFFSDVTIFGDAKNNYILSSSPPYLAITDKNFKLKYLVGEAGSGPENLDYPIQGVAIDGNVYVLDRGSNSIKVFDTEKGVFISGFKIPELTFNSRFEVDCHKNVLLPIFSPFDSNVILKVDMEGKIIDRFHVDFPDGLNRGFNRQLKHFQKINNNFLLVIGASLPYVEIVSYNSNESRRISLNEIEPIKRSIDSLNLDFLKTPPSKNAIPMIILDSQYECNKLYVSFVDRVGIDRSLARNLLVLDVDFTNVRMKHAIKFRTSTKDDGFHPSNFFVDVNANKLYVQGLITKQIYVFKLPT